MWVPDIEQKVSEGREGLPVCEAFTHSAHTVCVSPRVPIICAVVRVPEVFYGSVVQVETLIKYCASC